MKNIKLFLGLWVLYATISILSSLYFGDIVASWLDIRPATTQASVIVGIVTAGIVSFMVANWPKGK